MVELQSIAIHRSLHKPNLFFGAEREPILIAALIPTAFVLSSFSAVVLILGVAFWFIASFFLRAAAKKDPLLVRSWLRFIKYQPYYPAKTNIWQKTVSKKQIVRWD
ncbi:MAG: VirB3 family type IV secretion system protein [Deltaproteobacteria bacterium]|jgi:type IV secretion system protein VirB3|nr:VirB3 family type IV secretion system protein [Deltaproteobacteria bacterium]